MTSAVKVFISYSRVDQALAEKLRDDLESAGVQVWIDLNRLKPGEAWRGSVVRAMEDSDHLILLFSSRSLAKTGFFQNELRMALELLDWLPPRSDFLIPARLDECKPPKRLLDHSHSVELYGDWDEGVSSILDTVLKRRT